MPRPDQAMEDAAAAYRRHMEESSTERMLAQAAEALRGPGRRRSEAEEEEVEVEVEEVEPRRGGGLPRQWSLAGGGGGGGGGPSLPRLAPLAEVVALNNAALGRPS